MKNEDVVDASSSDIAREYQVVWGDINDQDDMVIFQNAINDLLAANWQCQGGIAVTPHPGQPMNTNIYQAMVR